MTRTATWLRRLARPHARASSAAVLLAGFGAVSGLAALGLFAGHRLAWVMAAWVAILAVVCGAAWLILRFSRAALPARVAPLVERSAAVRPGSIALLAADLPGKHGMSADLFAAADSRAAATVEKAASSVHRVLGKQTRKRVGVGLLTAVAGAAFFISVAPGKGSAAFWRPLRAIHDASAPVRIAVDRTNIRRGETVTATIVVPGAAEAELWARGPGEPWRGAPIALDSAGRATRALGPLTADLHLRAASGRRESRELTVTVTSPPFLADLNLTARYPSYLGREDEPLVAGPDTVALPAGTIIVTRGTASAPLARAAWVGSTGATPTRLEVTGDQFLGRFMPTRSGTWSLDVTARTGPLDGAVPQLTVRLVRDSVPVVQVPVPGADTVLPLSLRQSIVIDARDDYGITGLSVVSRRVSRTGRADQPTRQRLELSGVSDRALLQHELDLRERGLLPGDTVRLFVEAVDNAPTPQVGRSAEIALRLATMEELRAQTRAATRDVSLAAESLAAAQRAVGEQARDLAQGRAREAPATPSSSAASGREPGPLSFEARERSEEIARQQAELLDRIEELQEAVEDIARAARAAGIGDSAFTARLAEVRELLRRAVTPELEAKLRELQEALESLDPEATREALRQLVEAQEELRRELERSQELFERAAIEGELASLAADAEALRTRQQEWNQSEGPNADPAAAAAERVLAELADSLAAGLSRAQGEMARAMDEGGAKPPADPGGLAKPRSAVRRARTAMEGAANAADARNAEGAVAQGKEAADALAQVPGDIAAQRDALAAAWRRETLDALDRALSETAALAERQEDIVDALRRGEAGAPTRSGQAAVEEGTRAIGRQIQAAGSRHALVSPSLERALGFAEHQMKAARQQLEQGDPNAQGAAALAQQALEALNATAYALARSRAAVADARSGTGFQEAIEQLAQLAQQQQGMNADAQGMMPMMGAGGESAMLQQLRALAARQRGLAQELERLQAGGMSSAAGPLAQEARELARQLERGRLDRKTIERQEQLYRRLLDAGRTLSGQEPDERKERTSHSASGDSLRRPADLHPGATGTGPRFRYPSWEELRGLTAEERRLVLEYFRRLNELR